MFFFVVYPVAFANAAEPIITSDYINELENDPNKKPSYGERFLSNIILSPINVLIDILGAKDVSYLVFQRNELAPVIGSDSVMKDDASGDRVDYVLGIFPEPYFDGIALFYDTFQRLLPIPILILMTFAGFLLFFYSNSSGDSRSRFKDYLLGLFFLVLAFRWGSYLWEFIFGINYFIVDVVWAILKTNGIPVGMFLETIWGDQLNEMLGVESIGLAILVFIAFFMTFVMNYQYTLRMIVISVLILIFPLVLLGLIFPSRRQNMNIWFHEFVTQVFMQAGHALALGLFFYMRYALEDMSFWILCAFLFGLPTVAALVTRLVSLVSGIQSGGGIAGDFGAMLGLAAIMNMGRLIAGTTSRGRKNNYNDDGSSETGENEGVFSKLGDALNVVGDRVGKGKTPLTNGKNGQTFGMTKLKEVGKDILSSAKKSAMLVGGSMIGGAISGMATGNVMPGIVAGGLAGNALNNKIDDTIDKISNSQVDDNQIYEDDITVPDGVLVSSLQNHYDRAKNEYEEANAKLATIDKLKNPEEYNAQKEIVAEKLHNMNQAKNALNQLLGGEEIQQRIAIPQSLKDHNAKVLNTIAGAKNGLSSYSAGSYEYQQQELAIAQGEAIHGQIEELEEIAQNPSAAMMARNLLTAQNNYYDAKQTLKGIDKSKYPQQYQQQEVVVQQAKTALDQTRALAKEHYPDLLNPKNNELIQQHRQAITTLQTGKEVLQSIDQAVHPEIYESQLQVVQQAEQQVAEVERRINQKIRYQNSGSPGVGHIAGIQSELQKLVTEHQQVVTVLQKEQAVLQTIDRVAEPQVYAAQQQLVQQAQEQVVNIEKQIKQIAKQSNLGTLNASNIKVEAPVVAPVTVKESVDVIYQAQQQFEQAKNELSKIDLKENPVEYVQKRHQVIQTQKILKETENVVYQQHSVLKQAPHVVTKYIEVKTNLDQAREKLKTIDVNVEPEKFKTQQKIVEEYEKTLHEIDDRMKRIELQQIEKQKMKDAFKKLKGSKRSYGSL